MNLKILETKKTLTYNRYRGLNFYIYIYVGKAKYTKKKLAQLRTQTIKNNYLIDYQIKRPSEIRIIESTYYNAAISILRVLPKR